MRRISAFLCLATVVALAPAARADLAASSTTSGTVATAVISAVPQKTLTNAGGPNGVFGFVIPLSGEGPYTLTRTAGLGHLDAYFFKAGPTPGSIGDSCSTQSHDDSTIFDTGFAADQIFDATETGHICPNSDVGKYAIIVARTGASIPFTFTH